MSWQWKVLSGLTSKTNSYQDTNFLFVSGNRDCHKNNLWPSVMPKLASWQFSGFRGTISTYNSLTIQQPNMLSQHSAAWWHHMVAHNWDNTGSCNGWLPGSTNPLPETMLTYHQFGHSPSFEDNFTSTLNHQNYLENYLSIISFKSPRDQHKKLSNFHSNEEVSSQAATLTPWIEIRCRSPWQPEEEEDAILQKLESGQPLRLSDVHNTSTRMDLEINTLRPRQNGRHFAGDIFK